MSNILVLFESNNHGHTKAMAKLVAEGAKSVETTHVRLLSVQEASVEDLRWADGIAVGSPTNLGGISWRMKQWWDQKGIKAWGQIDGKFGCVFSSAASWGGGGEHTCQALTALLMNFGLLVFGVTDFVGPKMSPHYGAVCVGEPRADADKEMCFRLGRRLGEWSALYVDGRVDFHPDKANYDRRV